MNQLQETEYLEKLKELLKSKSGKKNSPHAYPYIKKSCDSTIALPPIQVFTIGKFSLFAKFSLAKYSGYRVLHKFCD